MQRGLVIIYMAEITLTNGTKCLVDQQDFDYLNHLGWYERTEGYAACTDFPHFAMHRYLLKAKKDIVVTHKNGNMLDNRRENLVAIPREEYQASKPKKVKKQKIVEKIDLKDFYSEDLPF